MSTDLNKLINPDLPWRQREIALGQSFSAAREHASGGARRALAGAGDQGRAWRWPRRSSRRRSFSPASPASKPAISSAATACCSCRPRRSRRKTDQLIEAQPFLGALAKDPSLRGFSGALGLMARGGKEAAGPGQAAGKHRRRGRGGQRRKAERFLVVGLVLGRAAFGARQAALSEVKPVMDLFRAGARRRRLPTPCARPRSRSA